jgi:hypothetical protein
MDRLNLASFADPGIRGRSGSRPFAAAALPASWALLASLALGGCSGDSGTGGVMGPWSHESATRGDTLVVRTLAGSVWGDTMVLVRELAIGEAEGEEAYLFGQPTAMVLDPSGSIHVLDRQAREVRTFGPDGRHLRSFGGTGQGPGEFTGPDGLRRLPDGRLLIRDQQGARFSIFDADGTFLDSWPLRSGFSTSTPFQVVEGQGAEDGARPGAGVHVSNPSLADGEASTDEWRPVRVRYALADPAIQDTLPVPTTGFETAYVEARLENARSRSVVPFSPQEHWTEFRDGSTAWGVSRSYAVLREAPDGRLLRIERVDAQVPVDPAHAAQERERITANFRQMDPAWRWPAGELPGQKPWFSALLPGEDGTLWVLRPTRSVSEPNPRHDPDNPATGPATRWVEEAPVADVFDPDGRYLGPVRLPRGFSFWRTPWLSADVVVAVEAHPMGHEQVVRYRLAPASAGEG